MTARYEVRGATAWVTLSRPEAMNALNRETLDALLRGVEAARGDPAVRVLVLTGEGKAFCAGADLKALAARDPAGGEDFIDHAVRVYAAVRSFPKPAIAAVNGLAMAGGLELVMCCDLVIAADVAKLGDAHANFGVFPGAGGAAVLARKVPLNVAKYLLFTGDALPVTELERHGLVNQVVPAAELQARVQALAEKIATKSPLGLARMKRVADRALDGTQEDALRHELLEFRAHERSHDMREGLAAFAEKRAPRFEGR